jgi:hypothetical protein
LICDADEEDIEENSNCLIFMDDSSSKEDDISNGSSVSEEEERKGSRRRKSRPRNAKVLGIRSKVLLEKYEIGNQKYKHVMIEFTKLHKDKLVGDAASNTKVNKLVEYEFSLDWHARCFRQSVLRRRKAGKSLQNLIQGPL